MKIFGKSLKLPEIIFLFAILVVVLALLIFYFVDLRNAFGFRDVLFDTSGKYFFFTYQPFFFQHWGRNGGIAEIMQWSFLASSSVIAAFCAGKMHSINKNFFKFWAIISVAFMFMMLEDAGDIRHTLMGYVQWIFGEADQGIMGTLTELIYFAILGGLPLYALIRYWKDIRIFTRTKVYFLIGFFFYATAASLSFLGTALEGFLPKNLYTLLGEKFYEFSLRIGDSELKELWVNFEADSWFKINFFLMDSLVEENLEIIAGGALLAGTIAFLLYIKNNKGIKVKKL